MALRSWHGIGEREVYGKYRVHSVTWLDGQPMVEGVAPDDYDESGALLILLRIGGSAHVRELTDLPIGYARFTIVRQSDEIVAKHSPNSLAAKILEDDLPGWAPHAILRSRSKGPGAHPGVHTTRSIGRHKSHRGSCCARPTRTRQPS